MNTIFYLTFSVFVYVKYIPRSLSLYFIFWTFCNVLFRVHYHSFVSPNHFKLLLEPLKRALAGAFFMRFNVCHHNVSQKLNVPEIEHFLSQGATRHPKHQGQDKIHCPSSQSFQTSYVNTKTTKDLKDYIQSCLPWT